MKQDLIFIGEYSIKQIRDGKIVLPEAFRKILNQSQINDFIFYPGIWDHCLIINFRNNSDFYTKVKEIQWSPSIHSIFSKHKIYPTPTLFSDNYSEDNVGVVNSIQNEDYYQKELLKVSGKEFEKIVAQILSDYGFEVELNVRALGAEIDLLVCKHKSSQEKIIFEYKQKGISGNNVGISIVHRLYGLQEVLRLNNTNIKSSIIVSTTGFSQNSKRLVKTNKLNIKLMDFKDLLNWIEEENPRNESVLFPLFQKSNITNNNLKLKEVFIDYLNESSYILAGNLNCIELWGEKEYSNQDIVGLDFATIAEKILNQKETV